ncbi:unnamed protein product [Strongylus vulgaris]|uniref:Uncharacterized protein n=1 Tax=Strongylus vulgaris TaxID=40348 RepID=A0A3P7LAG6_STRVU|nr:unnamed protein product [Strongylus vulgaris]
MFDNIERPELKRFAENSNGKEWLIPTSVEEDMRRNDSADWNIVPTTVTPPKVVQGSNFKQFFPYFLICNVQIVKESPFAQHPMFTTLATPSRRHNNGELK